MKSLSKNPMYHFLLLLTLSSTIGLQTWRTLFNNFAVEVVGMNGGNIGMLQSVREIPGFLAILAIFALMFIKEHKLSALSILIMGCGVAATGFFPSYGGLLLTTIVMSFGFHYYETTNQSLTLQYFDKYTAPLVFGRLRSAAAASNVGIGFILFCIKPFFTYATLYLLIGMAIIVAAIIGLTMNPANRYIVPQQKKMVFRKKYWLFYVLTFFAGARRQIFVAFAVFLIVQKFHFSVQEVMLLFVINNIIGYFINPVIGKSIIRFGEKKVLSVEYFSMVFIFLSYAVVTSKFTIATLYILDHIFFNFSIAIRTYFQKVSDPEDIAPSMAVGFTINHIAAVFLPAIGGILWMVDYRIPFICGSIMSFISLAFVQKIRT